MNSPKEELASALKPNVEITLKLAQLSLEHTERLVSLNLRNAKIALEHGIFGVTALAGVKGARGLVALRRELAETSILETTEYSRGICQVAADAEYDFSALAEVAWSTHIKAVVSWLDTATGNAPAGSDIALKTLKATVASTTPALDLLPRTNRALINLLHDCARAMTNAVSARTNGYEALLAPRLSPA